MKKIVSYPFILLLLNTANVQQQAGQYTYINPLPLNKVLIEKSQSSKSFTIQPNPRLSAAAYQHLFNHYRFTQKQKRSLRARSNHGNSQYQPFAPLRTH